MKKKSFWKRTNRGFWVSMVLLAAVVVYVLVTQLMLIPQRGEIRRLGEEVAAIWQEATLLSDEQLTQLADTTALEAETERLKEKLEPLFLTDSDYLDAGVEYLSQEQQLILSGDNRARNREPDKVEVDNLNLIEDTATVHFSFQYKTDGDFFVYDDQSPDGGSVQTVEGIGEALNFSLVCKRVDGQWKVFRISGLHSYTYERGR